MTLTGVYVPLITPFDVDGDVDLAALRTLAYEVLDAGAAGVVALGTTAEPTALDDAERRDVVDTVAAVCRERSAQLLVGASTVETVRALRGRAEVTGALSLVPPFLRPGEAGVVAHFAALAAVGVPIVVYHVPYRTGQHLSAAAVRRLADLAGVVGVKYAVGAVDTAIVELLADPPADFAVLCGDDVFLSPLLALGAQGGILASAHLATAGFVELVDAWSVGATVRARTLGHRLAVMSGAMFAEPNPTVVKAVLHAQGRIPSARVRLPLLSAGADTVRFALSQVDAVHSSMMGTARPSGEIGGGA